MGDKKMLKIMSDALHKARTAVEPGTSWTKEQRDATALLAIRDCIGASDRRMADVYERAERGR